MSYELAAILLIVMFPEAECPSVPAGEEAEALGAVRRVAVWMDLAFDSENWTTWESEVRCARVRYPIVLDCPYSGWAGGLPDVECCWEMYQIASDTADMFSEHLGVLEANNIHDLWLAEVSDETARRASLWYSAWTARGQGLVQARQSLARLRECLGPADFKRMRLPGPVPLEMLRRVP